MQTRNTVASQLNPKIMSRKTRLAVATLATAFASGFIMTGSNSAARGAVEATQLDYVALDANLQCNRIFFQSSQHFKNTIFVMPRVVPSPGPDGFRTFDIVPTDNPNQFILNLRLYFPQNYDVLQTAGASTLKRDFGDCNMDNVKWSLNSRIADKNNWIKTISPIPLTSIEAKIPHIADVGRIGLTPAQAGAEADEVDILDYNGKSLTAIFKITNAEKDYFERQVVSPDGLVASIRFRFQARHRDGSVVAKIDVAAIQAGFAAKVSGQTLIAKADVATTLKSVMDDRNISITSETGASDAFEKMRNTIIEKVLKETSLTADATPAGASESAKAEGGKVAVKLVLDVIATKLSREISFNQIALPETATAQTEVQIRQTGVDDPNILAIRVKSGYQDPNTGFAIKAGQTVSFSAARSYVNTYVYNEVITHLNLADIEKYGLARYFPDMNDPGMTIRNQHVDGSNPIAVGKYTYLKGYGNPISSPSNYYWIRTQRYPEIQQSRSIRIPKTLEALEGLKIALSFSRVGNGNLIPIPSLLKPNSYFQGVYQVDTGRITITALQDLGTMSFRELPGFAANDNEYKEQKIDTDTVVQVQDRPVRGKVNSGNEVVLHSDADAIVKQKVVVLNVTFPEVLPPGALKSVIERTEEPLTVIPDQK